jgi:nucleoside 2-deoxyribosyltransferase
LLTGLQTLAIVDVMIQQQNNLWRTRTYLIGSIQYKDGSKWREEISIPLEKMGIVVFDPYKKPFIKDVQETKDAQESLFKHQQDGNFEYLESKIREIRSYDLNLVDRADFIIANIDPEIPSWGTAEEISWANRQKKPIFLAVKGGPKACPLWVLGMFSSKYIYNNTSEIIRTLQKIDSGEKEIDSDRWRLLRKEYR